MSAMVFDFGTRPARVLLVAVRVATPVTVASVGWGYAGLPSVYALLAGALAYWVWPITVLRSRHGDRPEGSRPAAEAGRRGDTAAARRSVCGGRVGPSVGRRNGLVLRHRLSAPVDGASRWPGSSSSARWRKRPAQRSMTQGC